MADDEDPGAMFNEAWLANVGAESSLTSAVRKAGQHIQVSREMALDMGVVEPTAEEQAERERTQAEWDAVEHREQEAMAAFRAALAEVTDPLARQMLDLHAEEAGWLVVQATTCGGCDIDGYEAEYPPWPCRTVLRIAAHFDIPVPEGFA